MKKVLVCALIGVWAQTASAQGLPEPKFSLQGSFGLPFTTNDPVLRTITVIQGQFDLGVQMPLYKGAGIGAGAKLTVFGFDDRAFPQLATEGMIFRMAYFGKAQYERYLGDKVYAEVFGKFGTAAWDWQCTSCDTRVRNNGLHWGGGAGLFMHATDNLAFGVLVSFEGDEVAYGPEVIGAEGFPGRSDSGKPFRAVVVGLGFSTRFLPTRGENMW